MVEGVTGPTGHRLVQRLTKWSCELLLCMSHHGLLTFFFLNFTCISRYDLPHHLQIEVEFKMSLMLTDASLYSHKIGSHWLPFDNISVYINIPNVRIVSSFLYIMFALKFENKSGYLSYQSTSPPPKNQSVSQ